MKRQLLACLALAATLLPSAAGAQERRATVSPFLEPLVEQPTREIPEILRGPLGAGQGRERLAGREALSLHLRTSARREELEALGARVRTLRNGRATVTVLPEDLPALAASPAVFSIALPRQLHPLLSKSLPDTGIPSLRTFSNGSFTGATGAGVVVGVIDSGIDFDHPNFQDAQGNTRIAFLLDQITGIECTAFMIDSGQCTEQDEPLAFGHGTHTTGTAAGNGAAPDENGASWTQVGVAPGSTIVFVKSNLASDNVVDALEYIFAKADQLGMPAVINLSFGIDIGAHDGTDPMEEAIDDLVTAKAGRAVVVAAGNSREDQNHAEVKAQVGVNVPGPRLFVASNYTPQTGAGNDVVIISGYYNAPDAITVQLISPSGESYVRSLGASAPGCSAPVNGADGTVQICNSPASNLDQATTAREILIGIYDGVSTKPPKSGTWKINVIGNSISGSGEVDFWMASSLDAPPSALPPAYFSTLVDIYETVSIPGTSRQAITVGAHITRVCWKDYTGAQHSYSGLHLGEIAPFSSFGPTRDNRQKPEVSAPGMGIIAPMAAEVKDAIIDADYGAYVVNDSYLLLQGTSMAAPHVTGAVALLLQYEPTATNATLRSYLTSNAREDAYTDEYEGLFTNPAYGFGKLDLGHWGWVDPYESNDLSSQAYTFLSGQILSGYVERSADVDYFLLHGMQAGDTVNANLTSLPQDYALALQARQTALDSCSLGGMSTKASSNNAGTANESIVYTAPTGIQAGLAGVAAYVRVTSSSGAVSGFDSYQLKAILTRPETTGMHNSTATAQALPDFIEMNVAGGIASGEVDLYKISVLPGKQIQLSASGSGKLINLLDANGVSVASGLVTVTYTVPSGGYFPTAKMYYAKVSGTNGGYSLNLKIQ